ncbi:MAG TPA: DUF1326 domain-containing protein, partial [Roseiarcus sp.]|nr:DUF1326 domain-containing protein [Roseiarcus sp.]
TFEVDVEARTARASIPGILEASGRPITSAVDGKPHRVRIDLPNGMEFRQAEIGNASARTSSVMKLALNDTYGQFNTFRISRSGFA